MEDPGEVLQSAERDRGAVKKCGSEAKDKNRFLVTEVLQLSNWIRSSPFIFFPLCTRVRPFLATDNSLSKSSGSVSVPHWELLHLAQGFLSAQIPWNIEPLPLGW